MTSARPSFAGTVVRFAGADLRHLLVQPGFLAFGGMVVLTVLEFAASANQAADSPIALSAGSMAVGAVEVLTLLGCLLLLFTGVETLSRDQRSGLEDFLPAYPFRTSAQVLGKGLVGAVVAVLVLGTAFIASLGVLLFHGAAVDLTPFGWVWGVLLPPTFLVWIAFVLAAWSLLRRRAAVYALGLIVLLISALAYLRGGMTWSGNWLLWGTLRWSDFGPFDLDGRALVWNRSTLLAAALFLTALAIALARRAEPDALARGRNRGRRRRARALGLGALALLPIGLGGRLAWEVRQGFQGEPIRERAREYRRRNFATWRGVEPAAILAMNLKIDLEPSVRSLRMNGTYRVRNRTELAMPRISFTLGPSFDDVRWALDGAPAKAEARSDLHVLTPDRPLPPGGEIVVGFTYRSTLPRGLTRNGGEVSQFVLPSGIVLDSLTSGFLPQPGFDEGLGVDREDRFDPPEPAPDLGRARLDPVIGSPVPFDARLEISAPRDFTVLAVGRKLSEQHDKERTTVVWETEAPVRALNLVAGRFEVLRREGVAVFHHPAHTRNVEEIAAAVAAARRRYSEWFHPYPWGELKLSEIPNWVARAQGFPTLLTFSEGFGFLSASDTRHRRAFWITAHEAAHQWWGNLVTPGKAPGADLLIEGLANYSALLLVESELGIRSRIDFALWLESRYAERRRIDTERPLIEILDTARPADETAVYDRGAWVFWMLQQQLGSARMLDGLRAFANQYAVGGDRPLVQDLVQSLRQVASDESGFQTFVDQWLFDVVTPEFQLSAPGIESATNGWTVSAILENVGTGVVDVEVAIEGGERFDPNGDGEAVQATFLEVRQVVHLNPGEPQRLSWQSAFRPDRVVVDPEAKVLQINRRRAVMRF